MRTPSAVCTTLEANFVRASTELLGEPDQKSFWSPDVAKPIHVFVLDDFTADELGAVLAEPDERLVKIVHGEHHAQVAKRVDRSSPVIGDHGWSEESRKLETTVAVRRSHHGDLDTLLAEPGNAARPFALDHRPTFELQAKGAKELDHRLEVLDNNADVVHPLNSHARQV